MGTAKAGWDKLLFEEGDKVLQAFVCLRLDWGQRGTTKPSKIVYTILHTLVETLRQTLHFFHFNKIKIRIPLLTLISFITQSTLSTSIPKKLQKFIPCQNIHDNTR